ncbi:MAG TPA: sigma-54 dependent transcriptional regulator [Candidatus Krumholzibacteria bacterium]|nr:sigma-54 dependent transcriptional regulator [Candidatus Krumholzibacteria bacterium]HPD72259.1 sigma-54 dependent transcriptional regulator [Candidatus Krumholzibacteria bacterium]HRY40809.1 sigma-54 dependent transcriptional regulator [Candidatus Krumholzibacteria bacterium]
MGKILLVDDEPRLVTLLRSALAGRGHSVTGVSDGRAALDLVAAEAFDLVLTDLRMEPVDGLAVIAGVKEQSPDTAVVVLTAYGDVATAVAALRQGAFHYLTKPIHFDEVAHVVEQALGAASLQRENRALRHVVRHLGRDCGLIGESAAVRRLRELIAKVAPSEATVLIRGESGVGKEVVARALHAASRRAQGPFVAVNCAAIAETLLESELFGYRKGAFTGADTDREGLFEAARGGTLLLDEIGEAGAAVQAKLLRVLEERKLNRVGDPREREVDVRVLAATNRPLESAIARGAFREDLYYRLLVFPIDVPPLRERLDDLDALARHFLERLGRRGDSLPASAVRRLRAYPWPGNVRELRNLIERAHILAGGGPVSDAHVVLQVGEPGAARDPGAGDPGADLNLDAQARRLIRTAIARAGGNKTLAAELLGITRRTLYSRLKLLGLEDLSGPADEA